MSAPAITSPRTTASARGSSPPITSASPMLYFAGITLFFLHRRRGGDGHPAGACHAAGRSRHHRHLQSAVHHPRRGDGVVLPHSVDSQHARQFHRAADDRRARSGISAAQSGELVSVHARRRRDALRRVRRRHRHRLDLLHAVLDDVFQQPRGAGGDRRVHRGLFVDPHRTEFHRHHPSPARAGADLVPAAAVPVVALCNVRHPRAGDAGAGDDASSHRARPLRRHRHFRSGARAAIRCCSSTCSGSTRIRPSTS